MFAFYTMVNSDGVLKIFLRSPFSMNFKNFKVPLTITVQLLECRVCLFLHYITCKTCDILTIHFHFTECNEGLVIIPLRIRRMSSVVVVDDVSPVVRTYYIDRTRYCCWDVIDVFETQHSVLFVCCVGDVDRKSDNPPSENIIFI